MSVPLEEVKKIAGLARLSFNEDELKAYSGHLNQILDYVGKLNELNTDHVAPTSSVQDTDGPLREDMVHASLPTQEVMKDAPSHQDGFFRVPKVIQSDGGNP
ncbi:Asp-tRNA(Asn)/Glu-tRNA(Gln) amidotransferase subunit GatC [bacterium]|nr:Asp-tRNA(Asn)/Glu-tRNA(Gln) amidotransferase subunit GatC [bacterium]